MMFAYVGRRAQISDVLTSRRTAPRELNIVAIRHPLDLPRLDSQSFAAIWTTHPADHWQLPEAIVTADGTERDWLAWLVNFVPWLRPFTAYCRVLEAGTFVKFAESFQSPNFDQLENACIGLILGEVLSAEGTFSRSSESLTASACASVLSFSLVRELALYRSLPLGRLELPRRWKFIRQITRQRERELDWREIVSVVDVLRSLRDGKPEIKSAVGRACWELIDRGELSFAGDSFHPLVMKAAHEMTGTREERVSVFERTLAELLEIGRSSEDAFAVGYLASRINPGTLTHAALVAPALSRYPSAIMWYGVCAGLADDTSILGEFGGIGYRLLRELTFVEAFPGRPRVDISASELEILLGGERSDEFTVFSPSQLSVELSPGVSTVLNWSSRARSRRPQGAIERIGDSERARMDSELSVTISRLIDLHRRIRGDTSIGADLPAEQSSLFDPSPSRRGGIKRR